MYQQTIKADRQPPPAALARLLHGPFTRRMVFATELNQPLYKIASSLVLETPDPTLVLPLMGPEVCNCDEPEGWIIDVTDDPARAVGCSGQVLDVMVEAIFASGQDERARVLAESVPGALKYEQYIAKTKGRAGGYVPYRGYLSIR